MKYMYLQLYPKITGRQLDQGYSLTQLDIVLLSYSITS